MSLSTLPEEVLELILLYVNTEDVPSVLSALERRASEVFWRRLCLQNGYKKLSDGEETWKAVFHRTLAWSKGSYSKTEYDLSEITFSECKSDAWILYFVFIKGNNLLLQKEDELLITDVGNPKTILQRLPGQIQEECNQSRDKLLMCASHSLIVYYEDPDGYKETFACNRRKINPYVLSDDYFVLVTADYDKISVIRLRDREEYSFSTQAKVGGEGKVVDGILNMLVLHESDYCLKRFDLEGRKWLEDLPLFGATLAWAPQFQMNQNFLVSWCLQWHSRCSTLKIWLLESNSRQVSLLTSLLPENIFWLLLEENYLIYSSTHDSFTILNLNEADGSEKMATLPRDGDQIGLQIASSFLVLSFKNRFKLVDYKKGAYIREVPFDSGLNYENFCVNDYFYIAYNSGKGEKRLCVYDFR